jgi:hypothetical protein
VTGQTATPSTLFPSPFSERSRVATGVAGFAALFRHETAQSVPLDEVARRV